MIQYWPMAIVWTGDEDVWGERHTYTSANSLEAAIKQFDIWKDDYGYKLASMWVDVVETDGEETKRRVEAFRVNDEYVSMIIAAWDKIEKDEEGESGEGLILDRFGDVWGGFGAGQPISRVKQWFLEKLHVEI